MIVDGLIDYQDRDYPDELSREDVLVPLGIVVAEARSVLVRLARP